MNQDSNVVTIDQLINQTETKQPRKKDKILIIQIVLLIVWAVLTAVVYFFGYDLLSPFIKV